MNMMEIERAKLLVIAAVAIEFQRLTDEGKFAYEGQCFGLHKMAVECALQMCEIVPQILTVNADTFEALVRDYVEHYIEAVNSSNLN